MRAYDIIKRKRDGQRLSGDEIRFFLQHYVSGDIPDYQMSSLLMAVFFRGLEPDELAAWTETMLRSGTVLDLSDIPGIKVDKHSTGGVGDKISIVLAPLVASCGVKVPMISGRGLGHTGGTLDKLESIPNYTVDMTSERFAECVRRAGLCIIGQTADLAPADRRIYALRDVTATVESIPLISSSIMSKKLAEGIDGLVLDVKCGLGAFMKHHADARLLATTMVAIAERMGKRCVALITDMNQPLGAAVGNALEIIECIEALKGRGPADIMELTYALGVEMLLMAEQARDAREAIAKMQEAIATGSALKKFREQIVMQGGDPDVIDDYNRFPQARFKVPIAAPHAGVVCEIQSETIGLAAIRLGAGRDRVDSPIDHGVGMILHARVGHTVAAGQPLVTLYVNDEKNVDGARALVLDAFQIGQRAPLAGPLIIERIGPTSWAPQATA